MITLNDKYKEYEALITQDCAGVTVNFWRINETLKKAATDTKYSPKERLKMCKRLLNLMHAIARSKCCEKNGAPLIDAVYGASINISTIEEFIKAYMFDDHLPFLHRIAEIYEDIPEVLDIYIMLGIEDYQKDGVFYYDC